MNRIVVVALLTLAGCAQHSAQIPEIQDHPAKPEAPVVDSGTRWGGVENRQLPHTVLPGDRGTLTGYIAASWAESFRYQRASAAGDVEGIRALEERGSIEMIDLTPFRVIGRGLCDLWEVRLEGGPRKGQSVWVDRVTLDFFTEWAAR